jgi:hypothetical protein
MALTPAHPSPLLLACRLLALALGLLVAFGPVLVASYLVLNGITMVRREGIRPANLLSLLAGLGIFGLLGLMIATFLARSPDLTVSFVIIALLSGLLSLGMLKQSQPADLLR